MTALANLPEGSRTELKEYTLEISRQSERSGELSVAEDGSEGLEVGHPVPAVKPAQVKPVRVHLNGKRCA